MDSHRTYVRLHLTAVWEYLGARALGTVEPLGDSSYRVPGSKGNSYTVLLTRDSLLESGALKPGELLAVCAETDTGSDCPGYHYNGICRHIVAAIIFALCKEPGD